MASRPGILTDWPWKPLGSFKYIILAPWVINSAYSFIVKDKKERDYNSIAILPVIIWRMLHNQLWISLSRYRTAKGNNRIVDKGIDFEQVDRERNWDDQILLAGILFYLVNSTVPGASHLPLWRLDGVILTILLHAGPVEFLYYWLHRALHHHFLYSRYHSHHHSSIVTEPITSVIHPFAEHIAYFMLFAIPKMTMVLTGTGSVAAFAGYITYIDLMNNMGHCNFELIPKWLFSIFPPLKYLMYTPSFHSLHHTQFRTNYSLFMPIYDYIYGTMDKSTDTLYEDSITRQEDSPDVVHLTHLTTPQSIYHLRLGFASLASRPYSSEWYLWLIWPVTLWSMMLSWMYARTFVLERHLLDKLKIQTWAIPKYSIQYSLQWENESINSLIEEAILEAEEKGVKVLSPGLLNQGEKLNMYGGLFVHRHPQLKLKVVDGSGLSVAVVLNSIPKGTAQVLFRGNLTKVAYAVVFALCQRGIKVVAVHRDEHAKLKKSFGGKFESNLLLSKGYSEKTWLVGDGLSEEEQMKATKGTLLIPFSLFPPKKLRKDCLYHCTPAMRTPASLENVDSCENWLPRRVMSAWRVAGIVHALEGYNEHECGHTVSNIDKVWEASLRHGFQPIIIPTQSKF
ncbi:FA_hydroxylase domain-containing protein/Wax2_C domain-containing protein [Cephalotus follicularis]|uniref:FA_hydroxylase domain-containing protein/Wax2_C domain-containing protein n=1 Tax=Cephalotus follicularis TaxID=3775 RepID=A0A1Q3CJ79_CEPFO|nr:FA_hydroxylase domain-containing protein/Wax2_C domain-containing protein [Cephalotus follicularis]